MPAATPTFMLMCKPTFITTTVLVVTCAAAAGCRGDPASPPSGLPVALSFAAAPAGPPATPTFTAAGDSVVAVTRATTSGCYDYTAAAGTARGALVLTVTATEAGRACVAYIGPPGILRVVVHRAPRGRYDAVLQQRAIPVSGRAEAPTEVGRAAVTLP